MNKLILKFVLLFKPIFERYGVNARQLEIILLTKLAMDDRRPFALAGRRQKKASSNTSVTAIIYLLLMGSFFAVVLYAGQKTIAGNTIYISLFMVIIALTLVTDFSSVLIDVRDNFIILPRPVNDATFTVSRILHISIHVLKLVISFALPGLLCESYMNGIPGGIVFAVEIMLATVFSIFLVNLLYLVILKYSTPERFNNTISYFQIFFTILVVAGYQIIPRLGRIIDINSIDPLSHPYSYFLPPVWFASFFEIIVHPSGFSVLKLLLAVLGAAGPFAAMIYVVKILAPGFNKRLSSLTPNGEEPAAKAQGSTPEKAVSPGLAEKLSRILSSNKVEQAGFKLTWWLTSRYRDFKVKVYPSFAFVPVYFVYFTFFGRTGVKRRSFEDIQHSADYILICYFTVFVLIAVIQQISQSEKYKAAWVMFSTAHREPGKIISGMYKAIICKYFIPIYGVICIFSLYVWGPVVINDLVFAFFNMIIYGISLSIFTVQYFPFSQPVINQGGKVFSRLFIMFIIGAVGYLHYFISRWEWAISTGAVISAIACYFLFGYFSRRDWAAMEADYS